MVARFRRVMALVLATSLITMSMPMSALADIFVLPDPIGTSSTNPYIPNSYDTSWREYWGKSKHPQFSLDVPQPGPDQPPIVGALYYISRPGSSVAMIGPDQWPLSYNAPISNATKWDLLLDIPAEIAKPGPLFNLTSAPWAPAAPAVGNSLDEGLYEVWFQYFAVDTTMAASGQLMFGVDVTPPKTVTGFVVKPAIGNYAVGDWYTQSRVVMNWDESVTYDQLSGTGYFEAFLDGKPFPLKPESDVSRKVYDLREHYPFRAHYPEMKIGVPVKTERQMTIEDMPAGVHTLQVRAVDRATNEGPLSSPVTVKIDPDVPTVAITAPAAGARVGLKPTFSADTSDAAGVSKVQFFVDGTSVGTLWPGTTTYTAKVTPSLAAFSAGRHVLSVQVTDMAGRTATDVRTFSLDKTAPRLTMVSVGSNPFYPRLRDGYRDNYSVRFRSSEPATAKLTIKNSRGKTIRTLSKKVPAGTSRVTWNGKNSSGAVKAGTYRWYLTLTDTPGNRSVTRSGTTAIRTYQIKRLSSGSVQIIPR